MNAVLNAGKGFDDVHNFSQRLKATEAISREKWWAELVAVVERTFNIGKKAKSGDQVNETLLAEAEERALWKVYQDKGDEIQKQMNDRRYVEAAELLLQGVCPACPPLF